MKKLTKVKTRKIAELSIYAQSNRLQKRISGTSKEVKEEEDKTAENDSNKQHPDFTPRKIGRSQTSDIEIKQKNPAVPKNNSQKPPMPETKKEKKITQVAHQTPDFSTSFKPLSELATDEASNAFKPNLFKQSDDTLKFDPPPQVKQDADDNFKATAAAPFKPTLTSKQEFKNETQSSYFKPTLITKQDVKTEQSSSFKPSLFRPIELTSEKEKEPSFGSDLDFFKDLPTEKVEKSTPKNNAFKSYSHDFDEDVDLDHEFV